jgi:hypothetical protein
MFYYCSWPRLVPASLNINKRNKELQTYFAVKHLQRHFLYAVPLLTNKPKSHYLTSKCLFPRRDYVYVWRNNAEQEFLTVAMKCAKYCICQQGSPKKTNVHISRNGVSRPRNRKWMTSVTQSVIAANRRTGFGSACLEVTQLRNMYFLVGFDPFNCDYEKYPTECDAVYSGRS